MKFNLLKDFSPDGYRIDIINAFGFVPRRLSMNVKNRPFGAFIFLSRGSMKYFTDGGEFNASAGSVIYIPDGSCHRYLILDPDTECLEIDFTVTNRDGRTAVMNEYAMLLDNNVKYENDSRSIIGSFSCESEKLRLYCISVLYGLLAELVGFFPHSCTGVVVRKKLAPAFDCIETHCTEDVRVCDLAKMCYMSEPHFRRLFKAETGASPLRYKNEIRIKKACALLLPGTLNVSEVSEILGFENVFYFSRMFRQITGMTPTEYVKQKRNT